MRKAHKTPTWTEQEVIEQIGEAIDRKHAQAVRDMIIGILKRDDLI